MTIKWDLKGFEGDVRLTVDGIQRGLGRGMRVAMDRFHAKYGTRRLQRRGPDSIGPRFRGFEAGSKHLIDEFGTDVEEEPGSVIGRAHFGDDEKIQMIVGVLEKGKTIKARNKPYLKFKLFRAYSRRAWPYPEAEQWIQVKEVTIPPYLHFETDWEANAPDAMRVIEREVQVELEAA